jgi:hypothetical protein
MSPNELAVWRGRHRETSFTAGIGAEHGLFKKPQHPRKTNHKWCGKYQVDLDQFYQGYLYVTMDSDYLETTKHFGQTSNDRISEILNIRQFRPFMGPGCGLSLYYLLQFARGQNCEDPRDKIYSILAISDEIDNVARPNYLQPFSGLYTQLAIHFIGPHSLDFLGLAGLKRAPGLPSWVPDWTVKECPHYFPRSTTISQGSSLHGQSPQPPLYDAASETTALIDFYGPRRVRLLWRLFRKASTSPPKL